MERDLDLVLVEQMRLVRSAVPDPHRAGAVFAGRDVALEVEVLERMVLGVDGEPVLGRVRRDPVRDRPGRQHPVMLEPQVPVKPGRVMLLNDESRASLARCGIDVTRRL